VNISEVGVKVPSVAFFTAEALVMSQYAVESNPCLLFVIVCVAVRLTSEPSSLLTVMG